MEWPAQSFTTATMRLLRPPQLPLTGTSMRGTASSERTQGGQARRYGDRNEQRLRSTLRTTARTPHIASVDLVGVTRCRPGKTVKATDTGGGVGAVKNEELVPPSFPGQH